jgi:hypothetical protein
MPTLRTGTGTRSTRGGGTTLKSWKPKKTGQTTGRKTSDGHRSDGNAQPKSQANATQVLKNCGFHLAASPRICRNITPQPVETEPAEFEQPSQRWCW